MYMCHTISLVFERKRTFPVFSYPFFYLTVLDVAKVIQPYVMKKIWKWVLKEGIIHPHLVKPCEEFSRNANTRRSQSSECRFEIKDVYMKIRESFEYSILNIIFV